MISLFSYFADFNCNWAYWWVNHRFVRSKKVCWQLRSLSYLYLQHWLWWVSYKFLVNETLLHINMQCHGVCDSMYMIGTEYFFTSFLKKCRMMLRPQRGFLPILNRDGFRDWDFWTRLLKWDTDWPLCAPTGLLYGAKGLAIQTLRMIGRTGVCRGDYVCKVS